MGFLSSLFGGGGGGTTVNQTTQAKNDVSVGVTTTVNVDTSQLASVFEVFAEATVESQDKLTSALKLLAMGEAAQAQASTTNQEASLKFLGGVWDKTSRAAVAVGGIILVYWLFIKKG